MKYTLVIACISLLISCNNTNENPPSDDSIKTPYSNLPAPQIINYTILAQHPHDTSSYTQGLQLHNGKLYEGSGDYENSSLRITDWKTGNVIKKHMMGTAEIFGEGINIFKNKIYQLTWENNIVYVYDINNIDKPIKTFRWPYKGWGLTNNGTDLIVSDGTPDLYFVDPENFKVKSTITVKSNEGPVKYLNELEYVDGFVYANVYETYDIVKIDPSTGTVVGKMSFPNLLADADKVQGRTNVLNGIAYDSTTKTFLITGKRWPKLFDIKLN